MKEKEKNSRINTGILLSIQMIADELDDLYWDYSQGTNSAAALFRGCIVYTGQKELVKDLIYFIPAECGDDFPIDDHGYVTGRDLDGDAPHIVITGQSDTTILNQLLTVFQRYKDFEISLNNILSCGGTLNDMCEIGVEFFKNPLYVHDPVFCVLSVPKFVKGMREFEIDSSTGKKYIPLKMVNDFKFDENYRATFSVRHASIWSFEQYETRNRNLFVNLWDGNYYLGRVLIVEINTSLKPGQFRLAEYFAEYLVKILKRNDQTEKKHYSDFEDTFRGIIDGKNASSPDVHRFMEITGWQEDDAYVCLKLRNQQGGIGLTSSGAVRSHLSSLFKSQFNFFHNDDLCVIVNIRLSELGSHRISPLLAPYVRESLMYCGISNPMYSLSSLRDGFAETDIAMEYVINNHDKWIETFEHCALNYILDSLDTELEPKLCIAPRLMLLLENEAYRKTEYYETLRCFLVNERSVPKTSEELVIHRTTLLYRLGKIEEILEMNLDNPNVRLYLLLCFRLIDKLKLKE